MKRYMNKKGITLVELLAGIVITAIIGGLLYGILTSFLKTEKNVSTDALLRDEADYYIAQFINYIYTLKESQLCSDLITSSDPDAPSSYIKVKKNDGSCPADAPITGFYSKDGEYNLYIDGVKQLQQNEKIQIDKSSKFEKTDNIYKITLTLQYSGKTKSYFTEIHSIKDI